MAHDVTVSRDDDTGEWSANCADGDYQTDPVTAHSEALDSAQWHANQNGGAVIDDPPTAPEGA